MKITLGTIKSHRPCEEGWKTLIRSVGNSNDETEVTLLQILGSNGPEDAYWALRCWDYKEYAILLANVAESVVHIYAKEHPNDSRVQDCIGAIRLYANGDCSKEELDAARDAARDAAGAAARAAARDAAGAAARAAARAAAWAAARDAAWDAAWTAAWAAARDEQWRRNDQMMRDFLNVKEDEKGKKK